MAHEDFEQRVSSPASHSYEPTRSQVGRSGISVRLITLLSATLALGMAACTSEETPTEPAASASAARRAVPSYTVADLGTLGACCSIAMDINSRGQVVGSSLVRVPSDPGDEGGKEEDHAVLWEKGAITDLGVSLGHTSGAVAINPRGQVVGATDDGTTLAALIWEKGVLSPLTPLDRGFAEARDINPAGQVVGVSDFRAVLWDNGVMTDLGALDGFGSAANGINPAGQVVGGSGHRAILWEKGVMTDLGTLGGDESSASAINSAGQVVGGSSITPGQFEVHAFLWAHGVMTNLGTLGGPSSSAADINSTGQVVGSSETGTGERHAFLWENGVMTDLGALAGAGSSDAMGINSAGDVVGVANSHATLWKRN
jgi:probable HAF family extracellular repeat protein